MLAVLVGIAVLVALAWFVRLVYRGAPYIPSNPQAIAETVRLSGAKPGMRIAELGSGDGRVVMALAEAGVTVVGYERSPLLVWWSRRRIRQAGLSKLARVHRRDFWGVDLSGFDGVVVFGMPHLMKRLERKLSRELPPGAAVISNAFRLPDWRESARGTQVIRYERSG